MIGFTASINSVCIESTSPITLARPAKFPESKVRSAVCLCIPNILVVQTHLCHCCTQIRSAAAKCIGDHCNICLIMTKHTIICCFYYHFICYIEAGQHTREFLLVVFTSQDSTSFRKVGGDGVVKIISITSMMHTLMVYGRRGSHVPTIRDSCFPESRSIVPQNWKL